MFRSLTAAGLVLLPGHACQPSFSAEQARLTISLRKPGQPTISVNIKDNQSRYAAGQRRQSRAQVMLGRCF